MVTFSFYMVFIHGMHRGGGLMALQAYEVNTKANDATNDVTIKLDIYFISFGGYC